MAKVKSQYKSLKQLREEYPDIAIEYSRNLRRVQESPDLASYQKLYNSVLKLEEEISPNAKAKLLAPLADAARAGDANALHVINLRNNDTKFEMALQEYVEKNEGNIINRDSFSPRKFSNDYRRATQKLNRADNDIIKREAMFEITALLHQAYRTRGLSEGFKELLFNQREVFETRISDHDAAINLSNIRAGITQGPVDVPEKLDGTEGFVYAEIPPLQPRINIEPNAADTLKKRRIEEESKKNAAERQVLAMTVN